jgi:hypothetical protein
MRTNSRAARRGVMLALALVCGSVWVPTFVSGQEARTASGGAGLQLINDLVVGNRILANEGIVDGLGHISVRHDQRPDRFFISRDLAPGLVTAADLMTSADAAVGGQVATEYMRGWALWKERATHR